MTEKILIADADAMHAVGRALGKLLRCGDLIMLNGPLGAGKTTMTRGIAEGMNVGGRVTSPTFVIANVHRARAGGPDLVHVDAYRLTSLEELDALDLDSSLEESATVVEWGEGKTEVLTNDRLDIDIDRPVGSEAGSDVLDLYVDSPRTLTLRASGPRSRQLAADLLASYHQENAS
ncbi:tRNA (adenosine(37)-N6)-threonylcarbamoyltransferase complex ATPase subunit type 1 TsaE [Actinotignum sanguinis]|uniref:tRNA threonylcarbamoyladenosine biosynthesis protein TsaE n=1 Tax=Actinotignum sanguinis TaxID=1445614 RepID=A0ABT5V9E8_9ACTO|nr:tRNA (adenosine(37)-N6)-threonylcarbamoyltransferase complex ATPase subunit type 1 TsaE [Actinotignum sanguinis]MDE1656313.1 tRNA (adenosine(37)-N6)-threonylcarbamoyltransferase complex ATPase subunit type 1 TsaE [Actinotignum sanguinis]